MCIDSAHTFRFLLRTVLKISLLSFTPKPSRCIPVSIFICDLMIYPCRASLFAYGASIRVCISRYRCSSFAREGSVNPRIRMSPRIPQRRSAMPSSMVATANVGHADLFKAYRRFKSPRVHMHLLSPQPSACIPAAWPYSGFSHCASDCSDQPLSTPGPHVSGGFFFAVSSACSRR